MTACDVEAAAISTAGRRVVSVLQYVRFCPGHYLAAGAFVLALLAVHKLLSPRVEPGEPPILWPRIPIIGHALGMMRHQNDYLYRLYRRSNLAIVTLPLPGPKTYAIFSPTLIQAAFRSRHLDMGPFALDFAQRMLGLTAETRQTIFGDKALVRESFNAMHAAMTGSDLARMNAMALNLLADTLRTLFVGGTAIEVDNLYLWLRGLITAATMHALYGVGSPFRENPSLVDDLWIFEASLHSFVFGIPDIFNLAALRARRRVHCALEAYYLAGLDAHPSASALVRGRGAAARRHRVPARCVAQLELILGIAATANTVPTLFWLIEHIFSHPQLADRLRIEATNVVDRKDDKARVDVTLLKERCPLLVSCYHETIRLYSRSVGQRYVTEDVVLSDGNGAEFLLKRGANVQMGATATHRMVEIWGPTMGDFDPERFIGRKEGLGSAAERLRRAAFIPFGGGRHLCPGRNFAFAENLGLIVALLVGFRVSDAGTVAAPLRIPNTAVPRVTDAVMKPVLMGKGFGARIGQREGWEGVSWIYLVGGEQVDGMRDA